jgi:FtsP/CotA-like multicopper oxidase with cupredoxin domain
VTTAGRLSRRRFLALAGAGTAGVALASCRSTPDTPVVADDPAVAAAERRRRRGAPPTHDLDLRAGPTTVDLGGLTAATWAYGTTVPGAELRVRAGDLIRARFTNNLPEPTTVHWHGIAIRNDMDGVPDLTQEAVAPGGTFLYEFTPPDPGTFWFHPHFGLHLDRGLYAPLIVEDPAEPGRYDREYVVVLDDWIDGVGASPEQTLADLRAGGGAHAGHGDMSDMSAGDFLGGQHSGDVAYPLYLMNGRRPSAAPELEAREGERLRLRIVNAASDTPFRVAVGGHRMTVTHTDGFPVDPVTVDALVIGMAERYDVLVTVGESGAIPLVAVAEAKGNEALGVIRSGPGGPPRPGVRPAELDRRVLQLADLTATDAVRLPVGRPDRLHEIALGGGEHGYVWTINGEAHSEHEHGTDDLGALPVQEGERVRLAFTNRTVMFHPMHLHGHTFQVVGAGRAGARKDTAIVRPDETVVVDFVADNPGQWMLHCHNLYHQVAGMMTTVSYVTD